MDQTLTHLPGAAAAHKPDAAAPIAVLLLVAVILGAQMLPLDTASTGQTDIWRGNSAAMVEIDHAPAAVAFR